MQVRSLRSYCKVNLFLDVGRKINKLKLHDIRSLIFLINIFDEINVKKNKLSKDVIKFKGPFSSHVNNYDNSIKKSLSLLKEKGFIKQNQNYNVSIKKNIPVFSGLGGGSSNASSIIKYFLKGKKLSYKNLNYFTKVLGSDLRVFFKSSRILQQSLFNIKNLKKNYKYYFILVYPHLRCSTKEIYSRLKVFKGINRKNLYEPKSKVKFAYNLKFEQNSLQRIVCAKFPVIQKILFELASTKGCCFSRISGSGSACFGVFLNKKAADLGVKKIKKKFPRYWCVVTRTI